MGRSSHCWPGELSSECSPELRLRGRLALEGRLLTSPASRSGSCCLQGTRRWVVSPHHQLPQSSPGCDCTVNLIHTLKSSPASRCRSSCARCTRRRICHTSSQTKHRTPLGRPREARHVVAGGSRPGRMQGARGERGHMGGDPQLLSRWVTATGWEVFQRVVQHRTGGPCTVVPGLAALGQAGTQSQLDNKAVQQAGHLVVTSRSELPKGVEVSRPPSPGRSTFLAFAAC